MADIFETYASTITGPPDRLFAITGDDGTDLAIATRAINVAVGGSVRVTTTAGDTETINVAAGVAFPIRAARVWATGTTATGIKGLA